MSRLKSKLAIILGALIASFVCGFGVESTKPMPYNALLLVDMNKRVYYSFPCIATMPNPRIIILDKSKTDDAIEQGPNVSERTIAQYLDSDKSFVFEAGDGDNRLILSPMRLATMVPLENPLENLNQTIYVAIRVTSNRTVARLVECFLRKSGCLGHSRLDGLEAVHGIGDDGYVRS